ncbi:hypothetical protein BN1110_02474 [bacterium YEK0313]|nr:hypothetical protein BN1110_02474 [bacterium YEK0313]
MSSRPYKSPRRAEAAAQTRERIVAAAATVLAGPGAAGAFSLEATAKAAGVTRLTVYNQFGSRRALLEAVFDDRARRAGLHRLGEAMGDPDPHAGLRRLVAVFCHFWDFERVVTERVHAESLGDPEFVEALKARNERRRQALAVLVARMTKDRPPPDGVTRDLIDVLFALTSYGFFASLSTPERPAEATAALIAALAGAAVAQALPGLE